MASGTRSGGPRGLAQLLGWRRVLSAVTGCLLVSFLVIPGWDGSYGFLLVRLLLAGLVVVLVHGLLERWPARLPTWLPRWVLQVAGVAIAVPLAVAIAYSVFV